MATKADVVARLESLGYAVVPEDDFALTFLLDAVESEVLNKCNISEVPEELDTVIIDAVAGRFLKQKHDMGLLEDYDFTAPISSIKEGDINITYSLGNSASTSPEQMFCSLVCAMAELPMGQLVKYRRISW